MLRLDDRALPCVLHWGPDLGEDVDVDAMVVALALPVIDSVISSQEAVAVLPQHSSGWLGRPGLLGSRAGRAWSVAFDAVDHSLDEAGTAAWPDGAPGAVRVRSVGTDTPGELEVVTEIELHASGLLRLRGAVRNLGALDYQVAHLEPALPVPSAATELLDMTGRHTHERTPQRRPFDQGAWVREAWGGRPGHDAATVLCAGAPSFAWRTGRVWGVHLAWSGNQVLTAEHSVTGWRLLRGGELLLPGEIRLATGEEYASPWLVGSWGEGLDALSGRFHRYLRARPQHPRRPRPVLLNTWEAVYFDHRLDRLVALAERAAAIGIERYVLDDGWFRHRRDDHAGLGDWYVDEGVWPDGLGPLVDRVHALGMEFGLWFEPEMVNLDSDLAREHPEWLFGTDHGPGVASRYQHVLDLGHPQAYAYVLDRVSSLVEQYAIAYLKWDHNRALVDAGHQPTGTPGVHEHTLAVHRLMAELKTRHPGLEIESCAGGGGRVDLGILEHTDRVWVSDCIDAHERHRMVRWTGLTLPPEVMGTHVGSGADHSTGRSHSLAFRAGTAIWGHLGVEWDLTAAPEEDLAALATWIAFHREVRHLLHTGDVVHADLTNPALQLEGVVAPDGGEALYRLSALDLTLTWPAGRVTLPGLDPDRTYRVTAQAPGDEVAHGPWAPAWTRDGVTLSGRVLAEVGVQSPLLGVDQLLLVRVRAV
ncbi:alpha-galactosidase [Actinotalea sp.]|uniref:alpha-galactosidase n=1 Tax=Actinotalea sp. TaxID=1872145 RepID=UPI002D1FAEBD|nr:alpha-galactosidase [Actinotalea sp.]